MDENIKLFYIMTLRSGGNINQMINAWDPEVGMTGTTIKNFIEGRLIAAGMARL